jgi:hypothetical protein
VLPLTTVFVLGNPGGATSRRVGLGLVCVALASWFVLRRPVMGYMGLGTWPDYYIQFYVRPLYTKSGYRVGSPPIWIIYPSLGEAVDLLWLTAFLGLAVRRIRGMAESQTFGISLGLLANLQVIAEIAREFWFWAGLDPHGTPSGLVFYEKATRMLAVQALISLIAIFFLSVIGVQGVRARRKLFRTGDGNGDAISIDVQGSSCGLPKCGT